MPPARSEISTVMVTRGVWNAHSACMRACVRARLYQMQCVIQGVAQRQTTVGMVTTESAQVFMEIDPKWG